MKNQPIGRAWISFLLMSFGIGCENTSNHFSSASFTSQISPSDGDIDWQQQGTGNTLQSSEYYNENEITSENTSNDPIPDDPGAGLTWDWPTEWTEIEFQVLDLINHHRLVGADCGIHGFQPTASLLVANEYLTNAARLHAEDMALQSYF